MRSAILENVPLKIIKEVSGLDLNIKSKNCNKEVNSLLQSTVLLNGKRLRPLLLFLVGDLFGISVEELTPYAKSIECVHAASLAHDDVIDNATMRRGIPSLNVVSSNKRSVLAGDYLLADVIYELSKEGNVEILRSMANVIKDLTDGEWLQLDLSESRNYTRELIQDVAIKKTASVLTWCCTTPVTLSSCSKEIFELMSEFGRSLGIAFQLVDDVLDFSGESLKDKYLDIENDTVNSVIFEWLKLNPEQNDCFSRGEPLKEIINENNMIDAVSIVRLRAVDHINNCREVLDKVSCKLIEMSTDRKLIDNKIYPLMSILEKIENRKK